MADTPFKLVLDAIQKTKRNVIRLDDIREKDYPAFPVSRVLAHHPDCVLFVNDVNMMSPGNTNRRRFEYLLHSISKKGRYVPYVKPKNAEHAEFVMNMLKCSRTKSEEYLSILSEADINQLQELKASYLECSDTNGKQK